MRSVVARLVALGFLAVVLGGCAGSQEVDVGSDRGPASRADPVKGRMTANERTQSWVGACSATQPGIPITQSRARFCGTSYVWVEGDIDLDELPVILDTVNGDVVLEFSNGPDWNLTIGATASGKDSLERARQTIENFAPRWSHEEGGGHFLRGEARTKTRTCNNDCPTLSISLRVPDNLFIRAELDATNGDVVAGGHQYKHLIASTTNGNVVLKDSITRDVVLDTTNGNIAIKSRPYESGRWDLDTTNGGVTVLVPEEAQYGYDASGETTNGAVRITLRDGAVEGPARSKTFRTTEYASRAIQTRIVADTTNGDVSIGPA